MTEQEDESSEEQLATIMNIKEDPTPITLTIFGKENAGRKEIKLFLKTLRRLRVISNTKRIRNNNELIISLDVTREKRKQIQEKSTIDEYETPDGMLLTLTQNRGGYEIDLKEDLNIGGTGQNFKNLVKRLKIAVGDIEVISADHVLGKGGEETGLVAKLRLNEIKELSSREEELLMIQQLYQNLVETLQQRIKDAKDSRNPIPKNLIDDIEHFTHLEFDNLYKQIKSLTPTTYFLRELYGVVQARTNVTISQIQSAEKSKPIAENRHAMMYIARHRFPFLSSNELGIVFGTPTTPKNHATILTAQDLFDGSVGIKPQKYTDKRLVAGTLYNDAVEKRLVYLRKHPSRLGPNPSFEKVFVKN